MTASEATAIRRWFCMLAAGVGLAAAEAPVAASAVAQTGDFQAARNAPASWRIFAATVQSRLHDRLAADDDPTRHLHGLLEARAVSTSSAQSIVARVWVTPSGAVEQLEFDGLDDEVAVALRAVLVRHPIGAAPPSGMRQPISLRLSFVREN